MRQLVPFTYVLGIAAAVLNGCSSMGSASMPNATDSTVARFVRPADTCPAAVGWPIAGNLTPDGDFAGATLPPTSQGHVFYGAGTFIAPTKWLVGGAGIDFVNFTYWPSPPPAGNNVCKVDLDATPGDGSISETFNTSPGHVYHVHFWFSGSSGPSQAPVNKMQVSAANQTRNYRWNTSGGHDVAHDKYKLERFKFTATSCPTTLTFKSLDPANWSSGPVVTEISVAGKRVSHC